MTAIQLRDLLTRYCATHPRDSETCRVVIQEARSGVPHEPMVDIESAGPGGDWTAGMFILRPDNPLVRVRILADSIGDLARKRLAQRLRVHLKGAHAHMKKVREYEWLEGFKRGVEEHITSANEDEQKAEVK